MPSSFSPRTEHRPVQEVKPFAFDRVFASPAARKAASPEAMRLEIEHLELEVVRLKRELETAVNLARAEAFQAGLDHARAERDTALLAATDALQASLETLEMRFEAVEESVAREGAEIALAAADFLAAGALASAPALPIDQAIGRALTQVQRGQPIHVRVHPDLLEPVELLVARRQEQDRRRLGVTVVPDERLKLGDARLSWDHGGIALDAEARRAAVRAELEAFLPAPQGPERE